MVDFIIDRDESADLKKLADAFFDELLLINVEYGGIGLDPKRPFGNSSVARDMLELIEWKPFFDDEYSEHQIRYVEYLYHEKLIPYLKNHWKRTKDL